MMGKASIASAFAEEQLRFLLSPAKQKIDYSKVIAMGPMRAGRWECWDPGLPWPITGKLWRADGNRCFRCRCDVGLGPVRELVAPASAPRPVPATVSGLECAADQLDQRLIGEGLLEEPDRTRRHGPLGDTVSFVGSDEDQGQSDPFKGETPLDLQPVHAGHLHVHHRATKPLR